MQDAVVLFDETENLTYLISGLRHRGYIGPIIGTEDIVSVLREESPSQYSTFFSAQYIIPASPDDAENKAMYYFLDEYVQHFGHMPTSIEELKAFDGVNLLIQAYESGGFEKVNNYVGLAGKFDLSNGVEEGISTVRMYEIVEGNPVDAR
jgi:hypothetical protein